MKKNFVNLTMGGGILCLLAPMFSANAENSLRTDAYHMLVGAPLFRLRIKMLFLLLYITFASI